MKDSFTMRLHNALEQCDPLIAVGVSIINIMLFALMLCIILHILGVPEWYKQYSENRRCAKNRNKIYMIR